MRIATILLTFCLAYGARFSLRNHSSGSGSLRCLAAVARSFLPRLASPEFLLLAVFHIAQLAAIVTFYGSEGSTGAGLPTANAAETLQSIAKAALGLKGQASPVPASRCITAEASLWDPLFEELLFRFIIFYVTLQRSGGALLFSSLCSASIFSLMHFGNAWGGMMSNLLLLLQVLLAAVCGAVYSLLFASSGSMGNVLLLHSMNNISAQVWAGLQVGAAAAAVGAGAATASNSPPAEPAIAESPSVAVTAGSTGGESEFSTAASAAAASAGSAGTSSCSPVFSNLLLVSLMLQMSLYIAAGMISWLGLRRSLTVTQAVTVNVPPPATSVAAEGREAPATVASAAVGTGSAVVEAAADQGRAVAKEREAVVSSFRLLHPLVYGLGEGKDVAEKKQQ